MKHDRRPVDEALVFDFVRRLEEISLQQQVNSRIIGMITLANFCFAMLTISVPSLILPNIDRFIILTTLQFSTVVLAIYASMKLYMFDKCSQEGHLIYQEISDELEWNGSNNRVSISTRYTLRKFLLADTLPFFRSGSNGPAMFLFANILFAMLSLMSIKLAEKFV